MDAALALQKPFLVVPCCALELVEALLKTQWEVENYGGKNPGILGDFRRFFMGFDDVFFLSSWEFMEI